MVPRFVSTAAIAFTSSAAKGGKPAIDMASKAHEPHEPHQCAAEPAVNCSPMEHGEGLGNDSCGKDSQYHEVSSTTVVPIKSGREDKMVFDSDRPGSAGTSHSVEIDEEDEQMLANLAPSKTDAQSSPTPSAANARVFARSDHISEPGDPQGFMFGKPLQKKLDFQGTRASHAPRTLSPPTNSEGRSALPSTGDNNDSKSVLMWYYQEQS